MDTLLWPPKAQRAENFFEKSFVTDPPRGCPFGGSGIHHAVFLPKLPREYIMDMTNKKPLFAFCWTSL